MKLEDRVYRNSVEYLNFVRYVKNFSKVVVFMIVKSKLKVSKDVVNGMIKIE